MTEAHPDGVRLQKVLAQAGVASRRAAEELIAAGRVSVTLDIAPVKVPSTAFARTVAMEFDVSELSLVTFLQAKANGRANRAADSLADGATDANSQRAVR